MINPLTTSRRTVRVAIIGLALVAVAGCSSDATKSAEDTAKKIKPAASVTKDTASSTTTAAPSNASCTTAAAQVALNPDHVIDITCNGAFAAGSASNTVVDYAYLLQDVNGTWQKASTAVQTEVCTSNPQGLPASFVASACND